jgi:hypothetical protein
MGGLRRLTGDTHLHVHEENDVLCSLPPTNANAD